MFIRNVRIANASDSAYPIKDVMVTKSGHVRIIDSLTEPDVTALQYLEVRDAHGKLTMMPGLFDAHVHGQCGDFSQVGERPEQLPHIMSAIGQTGASYVMATLVSLQIPTLVKAIHAIDAYIQEQAANPTPGLAQIVGVHLEGPFIAKNCKGAHDIHALQDSLSLGKFKEIIAAAPNIKEWKMTIAPDLPGADEFIQSVKELEKDGISVKIFIGHSNPDAAQIDRAVKAGAAGFTHLGNACMETCSRESRKLESHDAQSNLVKWVLDHPEACPNGVELIVDGMHLSQSFVSLIKDKIGKKIMLVTDALGAAGLSDGQYKLGTLNIRKDGNSFYLSDVNGDFIMKDGTLPDGSKGKVKSLAGSAAPLSHCIETYYQWMAKDESVDQRMAAVYSAVITNPRNSSLSTAALQKLDDDKNFVIFNDQGKLVMSLCHGHLNEHPNNKRLNDMVVIYGATAEERKCITDKLQAGGVEVMLPKGTSVYQQERSFVYGEEGKGHPVALIVFGNDPISFGVLSQDIITKQLPVVIYLANPEGVEQFKNFKTFLSETNKILLRELVDSFCLQKSNVRIVLHHDIDLIGSIKQVYATYLQQSQDKRKVRQEATQVSDETLKETRNIFSAKAGFGSESRADTQEKFTSKLNAVDRPTAAYFGPVFKPRSDMCNWGSCLSGFNLLYGMGGEKENTSFADQSTMYQFAYNASKAGARVFGVIPHGQTDMEIKKDFSKLDLKGWYITRDLAERMRAFAESDVIIVGSCGTGTYEEVLDILRSNPDKPVWIFNNDDTNSSLVTFLNSCKIANELCFKNVTAIRYERDFVLAVEAFKQKHQGSLGLRKNGLWSPSLSAERNVGSVGEQQCTTQESPALNK